MTASRWAAALAVTGLLLAGACGTTTTTTPTTGRRRPDATGPAGRRSPRRPTAERADRRRGTDHAARPVRLGPDAARSDLRRQLHRHLARGDHLREPRRRRRPTARSSTSSPTPTRSSDDGLTIDFTLKQGVQFHGGYGEMTMDDVKFSIERAAGLLDDVETTSITAFYTALESVEVIDDYTGRIVLKEPSVTLVEQALPLTGIISKAAYEELGVEGFQRNPIGTGPYELAEVVARRARPHDELHRVRRAGAVRARRAVRRDRLPDHPRGQRRRARLRGRRPRPAGADAGGGGRPLQRARRHRRSPRVPACSTGSSA